MQLSHRFTLPASVEQAWTAFYFPNRIAPCFPGATLNRVRGDQFDGMLKIKLGPVPVQYEGTATFLERSAEDQRIVVEAHGNDRRGHGTITATVGMTFTESESGTDVEVISTVELTAQGASFGETVVREASDRLVQRLVDCVSAKFADGLGDLPSAEELATATPAEQVTPEEAVGGVKSEAAEPQEAVGAVKSEAAEPQEAVGAVKSEAAEPQEAVGPDRVPAADVAAGRDEVEADKTSAVDTEDVTAGSTLSRAPAPNRSAPLSTTTRRQGSALATVLLPQVRRFAPPVLGALVVGSVITGIVRRLRR
jgi:uncharacterized protein